METTADKRKKSDDASHSFQANPFYYLMKIDQLDRAARQQNAAEELKKRAAQAKAKAKADAKGE